jgi:hypothetical protein
MLASRRFREITGPTNVAWVIEDVVVRIVSLMLGVIRRGYEVWAG